MYKIEQASLRNRDQTMKSLGRNLLEHYKQIDSFVSDTKDLGEGGNGSVLVGKVNFMNMSVPIESIIAIKTSKHRISENGEDSEGGIGDSIHYEFQVMKQINTLLDKVPNFPTCLLYLKCPTEDPHRRLCDSNSSGNSREYILQEKIDGLQIRDFVEKTKSESMWLSILLQILVALQVAQDHIEFTHYDLHSSNFIIRKIESQYPVIMQIEMKSGEKINIPTFNYIPVIIDFGRAHVKLQTKQTYLANEVSFNNNFTYADGTKTVLATKFSPVYDLVEITRSMFKKYPAQEEDGEHFIDEDLNAIEQRMLKEYGGYYNEEHYSLPQNETGKYTKPLDLIKELWGTQLARKMMAEASQGNPRVFSWKNKAFLPGKPEYGIRE